MDEISCTDSGGTYERFIWELHSRFPDDSVYNDALSWAAVVFDSLVDQNGIHYDNNSTSVRIDSLLIFVAHENFSGTPDTVVISVLQKASGGRYGFQLSASDDILNSSFWKDTLILTQSLTPGLINLAGLTFRPNLQLPTGQSFIVSIEFYGDIANDFYISAGYCDVCGQSCVAEAALIPNNSVSRIIKWLSGTNLSGISNDFYYPCNRNPPPNYALPGNCELWYIQNINTTAYVTLDPKINANPILSNGNPCGGGVITLDAGVSGGSGDFSVSWSGSVPVHYPNSAITTVKIPVAGNFTFTVTVVDNIEGDTSTQSIDIFTDCVYISGTVYNDNNHNCQQDTGDLGVSNILIDISPGGGAYTDSSGNYNFIVDTGAYTVESMLPFYYDPVCPLSNLHFISLDSAGLSSPDNNFAIELSSYLDVRVSLFCGPARPGFQEYISLTVHSTSASPVTGYIEFSLDNRMTYVSAVGIPPDSINPAGDKIYWNFSSTGLYFSKSLLFYAQIPPPPTVNSGDVINHSVKVYPIAGDADTLNNSASCSANVTNSYDPNDKAVSPKGIGNEGYIFQHDMLMYYTIRFQNTGTDTAFNVVIRDTLDSNLDYTSFEKGTSSHPYTAHFEEDDIVVFTFENILLPDSNVNEPASNGHVTYYIRHKNNLPFGATISNSASIYFDFNAPVITNTVSNKIFDPVRVKEYQIITDNIQVYPNPNDGNFTVWGIAKAETNWVLELYSLEGKKLFSENFKSHRELNVTFSSVNLTRGIYVLKAENGEGILTREKILIH